MKGRWTQNLVNEILIPFSKGVKYVFDWAQQIAVPRQKDLFPASPIGVLPDPVHYRQKSNGHFCVVFETFRKRFCEVQQGPRMNL